MQFNNFLVFLLVLTSPQKIILLGICFMLLYIGTAFSEEKNASHSNIDLVKIGIVRVIQPGVFDYQSEDYLIRMRAWGVTFPERGQPGYDDAINFTELKLLDSNASIKVRKAFDQKNLKVVEVFTGNKEENFSRVAIENGVGWHHEEETDRTGSFVIAQMKAKRQELGIWQNDGNFRALNQSSKLPTPLLKRMIGQNPFSSSINYWVTSFGKIHRPNCSFYERGRGTLSRRPTGTDCRICGGTNPR